MRCLIVGTGRSGTGWAADVLRSAGVNATHQGILRHEHVLGRVAPVWPSDVEVECSYEATPYLWLRGGSSLRNLEVDRVVLLVRHPLRTIYSWLRRCDFGEDLLTRFADLRDALRLAVPAVYDAPPGVQRAARFWRMWNGAALAAGDLTAVRIEGLQPRDLLMVCGVEYDKDNIFGAPEIGTRDPTDPLYDIEAPRWEDLGPERIAVEELAAKLGYDVPTLGGQGG